MAGGAHTLVRNVSSGAVAAIAAWSSYSHMVHLAVRHGERAEVACALPFSVDGMLIVSTIVMVDDKRHGHRVRPMARLAFTLGVIASIAANIAAAHPTLGARIIAAWPAIALLLVVEMLARPPADSTTRPVQTPAEPPVTKQPGLAEAPPAVPLPTDVPPVHQVPPPVRAEVPPAVPPHTEVPPVRQVPPPDEADVRPQNPARVEVSPVRHPHPASATTAHPSPSAHRPVARRRLQIAGTSPDALVTDRTGTGELPDAAHRRPGRQAAAAAAAERRDTNPRADVPVAAEPRRGTAAEPPPATELPRPGPAADVPATAEPPVGATTAEALLPQAYSLAGVGPAGPGGKQPAGAPSADRASAAGKVTATAARRRPTATTRQLAHTIMAAEPHLSRNEVANRLGVSARRLREVLAA